MRRGVACVAFLLACRSHAPATVPVPPRNVVAEASTYVFQALGVNDSFRPNDRARYELRLEGASATIHATVERSRLGRGSTLADADQDRSWQLVQQATYVGSTRRDGEVRILEFPGDGGPIVYRCQDEGIDAADAGANPGGTRMKIPECAAAAVPPRAGERRVMALMCRLETAPGGTGVELSSQKDEVGGWLAFGSPGIEYVMQRIDCAIETTAFRRMP